MIRNLVFLLYTIENIGLPILCAILRTTTPKAEETAKIRDMLDRAVQITQELEKKLGTKNGSPTPPDIKLKLAGAASRAVAARFEQTEQVPDEGDISNILENIEAILLRTEIFEFQNTADKLTAGSVSEFTEQSYQGMLYIEAFSPILHPIAEFSYGQSESKLIQSVSDTLLKHSRDMRIRLFGQTRKPEADKEIDIAVLKALARLYAETHTAETRKIMKMDEHIRLQNGSMLTIDIVWRAFERKCAMLEALIEGLIPAQADNTEQTAENLTLDDILGHPLPVSAATYPLGTPPKTPLSYYKKSR